MKILFYDTQSYDRESFDRTKEQFPEIEVEYLKTGLAARTASLAKGYDAEDEGKTEAARRECGRSYGFHPAQRQGTRVRQGLSS